MKTIHLILPPTLTPSPGLQCRYTVFTLHVSQPPETPLTTSTWRRSANRFRVPTIGDIARLRFAGEDRGTAEERREGREAGADEADVELDSTEDENGNYVPDVVRFAEENDAIVEGDDGGEAGPNASIRVSTAFTSSANQLSVSH